MDGKIRKCKIGMRNKIIFIEKIHEACMFIFDSLIVTTRQLFELFESRSLGHNVLQSEIPALCIRISVLNPDG